MALLSNESPYITRTDRGLTITGTRITLYDVMDYVLGQYPPKFIRAMLGLSEEQINAALIYINNHHSEVEAEYALVLQDIEDLRHYYDQQNHDRVARLAAMPPKPGTEAIRAKLQTEWVRLEALQ